LFRRIPKPLHKGGVLLLWTLCHDIHRNNITFVYNIKVTIQTTTFLQCDKDIEKYIAQTQDNLALFTSTDMSQDQHLDLIHPLFEKLLQCTVPNFMRSASAFQTMACS
jgi:hypothetical protein